MTFWTRVGGVKALFAAFIWLALTTTGVFRWLIDRVPQQRVIQCEVTHSHGVWANITLENGEKTALNFAQLRDPGKCLPAGASLEKRRWKFGYRVNGSAPYYDLGNVLGPLSAGFFGLIVGATVAYRLNSPPRS